MESPKNILFTKVYTVRGQKMPTHNGRHSIQ